MTVLIPVTCCRTARATPNISAGRTAGAHSSARLVLLCESCRTSATSASIDDWSRTRIRICVASCSRPFAISQWGLSGWNSTPRKSAAAGITANPNMSRQSPDDDNP